MKRLEIAITEPVNCAPICPAPVSMQGNLIAEIEDPERPGGEQCNQKSRCRQSGQLVIDCKKQKLQKTKGKKMGDKSPYLAARREWEERYGCFVSAAHSWKITATLSLIIALLATGGAIYLASQKKVTAYIVEIDKFGSIVQVQQSGTSDQATTKKVIIAQLAGFVKKLRDVSLDAQLQRQNVFDAYVFLQKNTPAFTKVTEFFKKNDPFERAKKETVFSEIISVLPLKDNAFQVEWRETIMDRQSGQTLSISNYKLVAYTSMSPPTDEGNILKNPTGLIINDLNWSKEI